MGVRWKIEGIFKADAQKVADEIGENKITPQEILEKARDENTELHKCFEWDDSIAAEKYRFEQARKIVQFLVYERKTESEPQVRCFQITSNKNVYQPAKQFLVQQDEYKLLLERAKNELISFKRRFSMLTELESIFEAIDNI